MPDYEIRQQPQFHPQATGSITPGTVDPTHGPANPEVKHEKSDANVRAIIWFAVGLTAFAVIAHLVLAGLQSILVSREQAKNPPMTPITRQRPQLPQDLKKVPDPLLQTDELGDYQTFVEQDEARLRSPKTGIPIDEAMRIVADPKKAEALGIRVRPQVHEREPPGAGPKTQGKGAKP
jgi:hypothetical protein